MKKITLIILLLLSIMFCITPEIHASDPPEITGPDTIYKEKDRVLTMTQILALYSSDGGDVIAVEDNYTGLGDVPGIYPITLGIDGELSEKEVSVSVRSTIGNVIAVTETEDAFTIHMHKNHTLTANQIVDVLVNIQLIVVTSGTEITIMTNTYSDNADAPGIYSFEFHLATTAGTEEMHTIALKVNDTEQLLPDIVVEEPTSTTWWESFWPSFKTLFVNIITTVAMVLFVLFAIKWIFFSKKKRGI
jgi:hypothetical protein